MVRIVYRLVEQEAQRNLKYSDRVSRDSTEQHSFTLCCTMALSELRDFLTCPVCLDTYTEPVSLSCHHSFCYSCLKDYWDKNQDKSCPVCRRMSSKEDLDINFSLRELGAAFRQRQKSQQQWMCSVHPEVPGLFCKDEARLLCPVCEFSLHTQHKVVSAEVAERELKEPETTYERLQEYTKHQAAVCMCHIRAVFEELHRFLKQEQEKALAVLRGEQLRQSHSLNSALQILRDRLSSLSTSNQELEQRTHTDTWTFLKTATEPHNKDATVTVEPPWPKEALLNQAKVLGNLGFRVWKKKMKSVVHYSLYNTAEESVFLSEDLSSVRHGETDYCVLRFTSSPSVLGSEGFSSGTHQWDVEVGDYKDWVTGVAKESVQRKEQLYATPEYGIWCLKHKDGKYTNGLRNANCSSLTPGQDLKNCRGQCGARVSQICYTILGICFEQFFFLFKMLTESM
uniref:Uncharacterized protein n=1 Tax=Periophthalmus magnuspinnatus TaxID=409849 RepID=A0A3B3ZZE0_9GOBI